MKCYQCEGRGGLCRDDDIGTLKECQNTIPSMEDEYCTITINQILGTVKMCSPTATHEGCAERVNVDILF